MWGPVTWNTMRVSDMGSVERRRKVRKPSREESMERDWSGVVWEQNGTLCVSTGHDASHVSAVPATA
eukprot:3765073-Rhodomonas_salina.4